MKLSKIKKEKSQIVWKNLLTTQSIGFLNDGDFVIETNLNDETWSGYIRILSRLGLGYVPRNALDDVT